MKRKRRDMAYRLNLAGKAGRLRNPSLNTPTQGRHLGITGVRAGVAVLLVRYKKYFREKFILFPGRESFLEAADLEDWLAIYKRHVPAVTSIACRLLELCLGFITWYSCAMTQATRRHQVR